MNDVRYGFLVGIGFGVIFFFDAIVDLLAVQTRCGFAPFDIVGLVPAGHVIAEAGALIVAAAARNARLRAKYFIDELLEKE